MKQILTLFLALTAAACSNSPEPDFSQYEKRLFINDADTIPYRLLLPDGYDATREYPLVLFLHGAGERGSDNERQLAFVGARFLQDDIRRDYPCILLLPQCPASDYWSNVAITADSVTHQRTFTFHPDGAPTRAMATLTKLLHAVVDEYSVDRSRLYVGGLSMGGMGTFEVVRRNPTTFAAAFPFCGGAHPATAKDLTHPAWWIFHGAHDDVVAPSHSQDMFMAMQAEGAAVGFTLYPHANHNCWDAALAEPELLKWLFAQQKK